MEPLNVKINVSNSPYGHKMSVYVLLKSYEIWQFKNKTGILLYVVNIHPVYSVAMFIKRGMIHKSFPLMIHPVLLHEFVNSKKL